MPRIARHCRTPLLAALRVALLACALLGYGLLVAGHDHDAAPNADQGLCTICVHGTGSGAAVDTTAALPLPAAPRLRPAAAPAARAGVRFLSPLSIRGPPLAA
jgi:hypothetical protein